MQVVIWRKIPGFQVLMITDVQFQQVTSGMIADVFDFEVNNGRDHH